MGLNSITYIYNNVGSDIMPQISVYVNKETYLRLIKAENMSKVVQDALKKYWSNEDGETS